MLSKLAFRNAKRSIKDYIIYLITVTLAFSFIFAFNLIGYSKEVLELSDVMQNFKYAMYIVNIFIVIVVCFLINYTIKFMFSKRSKEFGTYMILGIKKKKISNLFTLENIILGFYSLLISIPIGYLFSILMSFIIMNIFSLPQQVKINFSLNPILLLILYFCLIYVFVLFFARRRIKKMKIYDLLYFDKQNEKFKNKNKILRNLAFIISIILGIVALLMFDSQFKAVGNEPSMTIIFICLILIIISIYGVTISLSDFILNIILKNKKLKYKNDNLFVTRTFASKVKTMSFTLGTLTCLITITLISLNISSLFKGLFDYQLELNAPYDISIEASQDEIDEYIELIKKDYTIVDQFVYNSYKETNNNISKLLDNDYSWRMNDQVVKLSDYNKLLELKREKPVSLNEDEYILHITKEYSSTLNYNGNITLPNGKVLRQKELIKTGYTYAWGSGYGFIVVVHDTAVEGLEIEQTRLIVNTKEKTTEEFAKQLVQYTSSDMCEENEFGYTVCYSLSNVIVRGQEEANNNGFVTITSFVCFYVAFVFIAVVGTILAIQSLSDSTKYKYRYQVLNKLGVNENKLNKTIFKQLLIFFIFPLIYPIIVSFSTIYSMNKIFQIALTTNTVYLTYFLFNFLIFIIIYLIYFIATYFGFKRNIMEDSI